MPDMFSVTSSQSWFSRIVESIKSVLFGFILFIAAFPVLFWNEGRAVRTAQSLTEGAGAVVSVPAASVDSGNQGKLVHISGPVDPGEPIADDLGVQAKAVKLIRKVEMYQWTEHEKSETRKKLGGGTETTKTYTYKKEWKDRPIDSSNFKSTEGHENPGAFPFEGTEVVADPVKVGAFKMSKEQIDKLGDAGDLRLGPEAEEQLPDDAKDKLKVADGRFYMGENPSSPALGDVRISYQTINPAVVSLVGVQSGESFTAFQAKAGDAILLVESGTHNAAEMFKTAQDQNTVLTWILRAVGFFLMFIGLALVFRPIAVFADVLPFVGTMLGAGVGIFAFLLAAVLSFVTIAVSWIFVRPVLGITLLVLAGGALFWLIKKGKEKKAQRAAAAAPAAA